MFRQNLSRRAVFGAYTGAQTTSFPPSGRHPARSGLNSQSKKPAYVALKTFAQISFYATYAGFNNHRNLNRYERTTSPFS